MLTAPLQLEFAVPIPVARPLVCMGTAMVLLDRDEDGVLALIELGDIAWAWDIATPGADRREVRVWRDCLVARMNRLKQPEEPMERVMQAILPHARAEIRTTELRRLLTCSQGHVQNLIETGLFNATMEARPGANGFGLVTRESVIRFFEKRRIC